MANYPVVFDPVRPKQFERPQVVIRLLVLLMLAIISALGLIILGLYVALPVISAVLISQKGGERFLKEDGPRLRRWLLWFLAVDAYIRLLTDRLPVEKPEEAVRFDVVTGGTPTPGSALMRLVYSIPSALVLGLLGIAASLTWVIAVVMILINEDYADGLYRFHRGYVRWAARLLAYHSSLLEEYPPYALETGPEPAAAL